MQNYDNTDVRDVKLYHLCWPMLKYSKFIQIHIFINRVCYANSIYKLKCQNCDKLYNEQTDETLKIRYAEFIRYTRSNNPQLAYAIHVLNNGHEGSPVDEIMELSKPFPETV